MFVPRETLRAASMAGAQVRAKGLVGHRLEVEPDRRELLGQPSVEVQAIQRRHQLAPGQVTGAAEQYKVKTHGVDVQ